jgi:hypothetical protein
MAIAFRLPKSPKLDHSFGAIQDAERNLARVRARHTEVTEIANAVQEFCDEHLFIVHVHPKRVKTDEEKRT